MLRPCVRPPRPLANRKWPRCATPSQRRTSEALTPREISMNRRHLIQAALAACLVSVTTAALADQYPSKTVTVIIPFPPGGTLDVVGRMLAQKLSEQMGQSFIVDNTPGRGRHDRRKRGGQGQARRLHAAVQPVDVRVDADDDADAALRRDQGLYADRARGQGAARHRDQGRTCRSTTSRASSRTPRPTRAT